ncbi:MAG: membrane protein insertase YidC, partial [Albidovulum sp.]
MDDQNKNLILATVLSFLVILVWFTVFAPPPPIVDPNSEAPAVGQTTDATGVTTPPAAATTPTAPAEAAPDALASAGRIAIETPRLTGSFSLLGGRIDDIALEDYRETLDAGSPNIRLLSHAAADHGPDIKPYYAVFGWSPAGGMDPKLVPDANTLWEVESGTTLAPGAPVTIKWDNGAGLVFHRKIEVDNNYLFTLTQSVDNQTGAAVRLAPYGIVVRKGIPDAQRIYLLHEGVVRQSDGELQEIKYAKIPKLDSDPRENAPAEVTDVVSNGWIGFTDKYWMTTLVPAPGQAFTSVAKYVPGADIYQAEARLPVMEVAAGASSSATTMLFAGAKEWEAIKDYQDSIGIA